MSDTRQPTPPAGDGPRQAREQATAYRSMFAPTTMTLEYPDGTTEDIEIPPHPNLRLLDDELLDAYEDLLFEAEETYDREPDIVIPEQKLDNGIVLPKETRRGVLKSPYRITRDKGTPEERTELLKPPWSVKVCMACLGDEKYQKLKAAGKSAADVWAIWNDRGLEQAQRAAEDPKSVRGRTGLAPAST
jgi:hypothetical protein